MRTMGLPADCPTAGPDWFVNNYDKICKLLVSGKTTKEIGAILDAAGVKVPEGYQDAAAALSNKVSSLVRSQVFPDFPQLKGYETRTTRRSKPSIAYAGQTLSTQTTTIEERVDTTFLDGAQAGTATARTLQPTTQFEAAQRKLVAISRLLDSNSFDETSKLKYIRAELSN